MRKLKGSISIFFTFSIILIISVILSVTEISRMNCQKLYLQLSTDAALDSMMSLYHRKLYEYYSLYGVEYRNTEHLSKEYLSYIKPYFVDENYGMKINNWFQAVINLENINLSNKNITDDTYLENEMLNYIKAKLIGKTIKFLGKEIVINDNASFEDLLDTINETNESMNKSSIYSEVYSKYFNFYHYIKNLEAHAKSIMNYISRVNSSIANCSSFSTSGTTSNGKSVLSKIGDVKNNINSLRNEFNSYKEEMMDMRNAVNESREKYNADILTGIYDFDNDTRDFIESEFDQFISYVDEDSDINRKVESGINNCNQETNAVNQYYQIVNSYVVELESLESALKAAKKAKGEDRDPEYIRELNEDIRNTKDDFSEYLKSLKEDIRYIHIDEINFNVSTTDHTYEENLLNKLVDFKNGIILDLVLPEEKKDNIKNDNVFINNFSILTNDRYLSKNKILFGEYELDKFNYYNKELNNEHTNSGSDKLEVERLITGYQNDKENISSIINKILLIRIAMNVLYLYKSSEKRREARMFSNAIFGGCSPIFSEVLFLIILTAWGTAQSIIDLRRLLENYSVKLLHDDDTFQVNIDQVLNIATGGNIEYKKDNDDGVALSYKDYLRILLLRVDQSVINSRIIGIVENNIKSVQDDFNASKLIYSFNVDNTFTCTHYFTNLIFIKSKDIRLFDEYKINTKGYRCFYQ